MLLSPARGPIARLDDRVSQAPLDEDSISIPSFSTNTALHTPLGLNDFSRTQSLTHRSPSSLRLSQTPACPTHPANPDACS